MVEDGWLCLTRGCGAILSSDEDGLIGSPGNLALKPCPYTEVPCIRLLTYLCAQDLDPHVSTGSSLEHGSGVLIGMAPKLQIIQSASAQTQPSVQFSG